MQQSAKYFCNHLIMHSATIQTKWFANNLWYFECTFTLSFIYL